jgi:dihydropteroate synthase
MPQRSPSRCLDCAGKIVVLDRPRVMGVINVTPDSFYDGGRFFDPQAAIAQARELVAEGADIIDIGGESTRPGAEPMDAATQLARILPVIERLAGDLPVPVSVDTGDPEVMRAAVAAGAGMINDVRALTRPGALEAAAAAGLPVCLMHIQGTPRTMQDDPRYDDVVAEVRTFLAERARASREAGIGADRIVIDPGFCFGKSPRHNYELLNRLDELTRLNLPILVGMSRKSMIKGVVARADQRLAGSTTAAALAVMRGADIVRVHDVAATVAAVAVATATRAPDKL